jgi:hypothetical protein
MSGGHVLRPEDLRGADRTPESWCCLDCGWNTAPGFPGKSASVAGIAGGVVVLYTPDQEVYTVTEKVWRKAGNLGACLCIGCLERRLGRRLRPKDFVKDDPFNRMPASARLRDRRGY